MTTKLSVESRTAGKALQSLREAGKLPGVVYGPKQEPTTISIDKMTFEKLLRDAGESTIITLEGLDKDVEVLIQEVAFDAARGGTEHVDFYAIERGKELTTNVPLHYEGEAPVEKQDAVVNKVLHDVEVTCRPSVLPSSLVVDISVLTELDSQITVADLDLPEGVKVENAPDDVVASVSAVTEEPEEEPEEVDMDAIEVEAKGKDDGDEGDTEAPAEE